MKKETKNKISHFFLSILICQLVGIIGGIFTITSIGSWYAFLEKPSFSPPNWVFGPVWTLLYFLMGVALFLVWESKKEKHLKWEAVGFFFAQLFLNFIWSFLFFSLENPGLAFLDIIFLWLFIILTMVYFRKISKTAFWLLVPYIIWVSFAAVLNFSIWRLN